MNEFFDSAGIFQINARNLICLQNTQQIYFYLYQTAKSTSNKASNYKSISNILCLLAMEFGEAEVIVEIVGFVFGLQVAIFSFFDGSLKQNRTAHPCSY